MISRSNHMWLRNDLGSFKLATTVRWVDFNPHGHLRHSIYYGYGLQARIAFLHKQCFAIDWMGQNNIGPVLFREEE